MRIRKNPKKSFLKLCKSLCVMAISEMKKQGYYKFLPLSSYLLNWSIKSWSLFHKSFDACRFWLHNNPGLKSLPCLNVITILIFNERTPPLVSILLWKKVSIISFQQSKKIFYFFDIMLSMTAMGGEIGVPEIVDVKIWWYQRKREDIETVQSGYASKHRKAVCKNCAALLQVHSNKCNA